MKKLCMTQEEFGFGIELLFLSTTHCVRMINSPAKFHEYIPCGSAVLERTLTSAEGN